VTLAYSRDLDHIGNGLASGDHDLPSSPQQTEAILD